MIKKLMILCCLFTQAYANDIEPKKKVQVDVVVFIQHQADFEPPNINQPVYIAPAKTVKLVRSDFSPYQIIPSEESYLKSDMRRLMAQPDYQVLAFYSWEQPINSTRIVQLPEKETDEFNIRGDIRIRHAGFYMYTANIYLSSLNQSIDPLLIHQFQKIKPETKYYIDNAKAGVLINVHEVA